MRRIPHLVKLGQWGETPVVRAFGWLNWSRRYRSAWTWGSASRWSTSSGSALTLRRAGLVHGFGRLGVSNSIWDRPGPLSTGEWERVRLYPYLTERMLRQSAALAPLGDVAVQVCERLDGSGYPRGLSGGAIPMLARVLGAAEAYASLREPRPYRPARSAEEAVAGIRAEVHAGRLDGAAAAVLEAAGHRPPRRRREALAGQQLVVTPKTASNHIEHIYAKIEASSRAAAAMFAVRHGLLPEVNGPATTTD